MSYEVQRSKRNVQQAPSGHWPPTMQTTLSVYPAKSAVNHALGITSPCVRTPCVGER